MIFLYLSARFIDAFLCSGVIIPSAHLTGHSPLSNKLLNIANRIGTISSGIYLINSQFIPSTPGAFYFLTYCYKF